MLLNTNSLVKYVKSIYRGEVASETIEGTLYERFDLKDLKKEEPDVQDVEVNIARGIVWHNFRNGYMIVKVKLNGFNSNGDLEYREANYEKWKIEKTESGWQIIDIIGSIKNPYGFISAYYRMKDM